MKSKVAIVSAIYNPNEDYLHEQIESYHHQTCKDFFVLFIIADGTSKDVVQRIAGQYSFTFCISIPRKELGPRQAFGFGVQELINNHEAQYVALSDQDDVWLPNKLEVLLNAAEKSNASLVHSNVVIVDKNRNLIRSFYQKNIEYHDQTSFEKLCFVNSVIGMTSMFTINTATIALPFLNNEETEPLHDWLFAIAAGMIGEIEYVDKGLVLYRQHNDNVIGAPSSYNMPFLHELRAIFKAWKFCRTTQPIVQSTLQAYIQRCKSERIEIVNWPPSIDFKTGRLFFCAISFIRKRKLLGLFAVIYLCLSGHRYNP